MLHQIGQLGRTALKLISRSAARHRIDPFLSGVLILVVTVALASFDSNSTVAQETEKVTYDDHIKPILMNRCSTCHNPQKREGDVDVTNYTNLMLGGGSGEVISPQDASGSYLYKLITHEESPEMPPSGTKIPDAEIQKIAKWIDLGLSLIHI